MSVARGREYALTLPAPTSRGSCTRCPAARPASANILANRQSGRARTGGSSGGCTSPYRQDAELAHDLQFARLERGLSWVAEASHMSWQHDKAARVRTLIMVSRLGEPLRRW